MVTIQAAGAIRNLNGWKPDRPSHSALFLTFDRAATAALPATNPRFSQFLPPIWDQGSLGSCTAHGLLRAVLFALAKNGAPADMLSRMMLYFDERAIEGTQNSDSGAAIGDGIQTLTDEGACLESLWPYDESQVFTQPPLTCYTNAKKHLLLKSAKVDPSPDQIKAVMATGWPVVIGFTCYPGLESQACASTGVVPVPGRFQRSIGGHCVCTNGEWDDSAQLIGFDNSWTADWGVNGSGFMPYQYFGLGLVSDCWVIYTVEADSPLPTPLPAPVATSYPWPTDATLRFTIPPNAADKVSVTW